MLLLRIIKESFLLAIQELINNKLRTILSLLGVTIGIFCMIAVFASVDSLEKTLKNSVSQLGDDVIYVQRMPWSFEEDYPWWKYINRKKFTYQDFEFIKENSRTSEAVYIWFNIRNASAKYRSNEQGNIQCMATSYDYIKSYALSFSEGRYFTQREMDLGKPVVVIGSKIAETLFEGKGSAIGQKIKIKGRPFTIIGVLEMEGESPLSFGSHDNTALIPYDVGASMVNTQSPGFDQVIAVKGGESSLLEVKEELRVLIRRVRRLKPLDEDDFALNQTSIINQVFDSMFLGINLAGLFIGSFSAIVGLFGIANIMFVSVRERTKFIGIKKALGAQSHVILLEFLIESVVLCLVGGLVGILLVFLLMLVGSTLLDFPFVLSIRNIGMGIALSTGIGILAGIIPAIIAARLVPVEAIRANG